MLTVLNAAVECLVLKNIYPILAILALNACGAGFEEDSENNYNGGSCQEDFITDYNTVIISCGSPTSKAKCQSQKNMMLSRYPGMNCTLTIQDSDKKILVTEEQIQKI